MMLYIAIGLFVLLLTSINKRYFPVKNVPCIEKKDSLQDQHHVILDIRNYNEATSDLHLGSLHIPYAYLRRFYKEIPHGKIHVIASDRLELNLGLRFLKGKRIRVTSYEIKGCPCKKRVLDYGLQ